MLNRGRILLVALLITAACATAARPAEQPPRSSPEPRPTATQTGGSVFVIVMENKPYNEVMRDPIVAGLASRYAVATNYYAISHPSLPNYLALTSGSTWGIRDDSYRPLPDSDLGHELTRAGIAWRAYMEGLTQDCLNSPLPYALNHNPFAFYGGACPANVVPFSDLRTDLTQDTPAFLWITPDACHDGHSCRLSVATAWLQQTVAAIERSTAWQRDGVLFVTWDEDDHSEQNRVATLVIAPNLTKHESAVAHNHYSLLATVEDRLGVTRLGDSKDAAPISELFAQP